MLSTIGTLLFFLSGLALILGRDLIAKTAIRLAHKSSRYLRWMRALAVI